jgi:hypothetical protein
MFQVISCGIMVGLVVCRRFGLGVMIVLWWKERRIGWRILLVVKSPLHGVVDFSGCDLLWWLCGVLLHFSFGVKEDGTMFGAVVSFAAMVHAGRRLECVGAMPMTSAPIWCAAYLVALHESLLRGSHTSSLRRCSEILLPVF